MEELANRMSKETLFTGDTKKMYFYVREPYTGTEIKEGFAEELILNSELTDGQLFIDGQTRLDMSYGDSCKIDIKPEYQLKCIKFIV